MINFYKKNKTRWLIYVFYMLFPAIIFSQTDSSNYQTVNINVGFITHSSIDQLYSYKRYSGHSASFEVKYNFEKPKYKHQITFEFAKINKKPDNYHFDKTLILSDKRYYGFDCSIFEINYQYLRKLSSNQLNLYISGNWLNNITLLSNSNPELIYSSIGPGIFVEKNNKKHKFSVNLNVPLAAVKIRNNYYTANPQNYEKYSDSQFIKDNLQTGFINNFFILYANLSYQYNLSKKIKLNFQYKFKYINDKKPRNLKSASGIYGAGIIFNL